MVEKDEKKKLNYGNLLLLLFLIFAYSYNIFQASLGVKMNMIVYCSHWMQASVFFLTVGCMDQSFWMYQYFTRDGIVRLLPCTRCIIWTRNDIVYDSMSTLLTYLEPINRDVQLHCIWIWFLIRSWYIILVECYSSYHNSP